MRLASIISRLERHKKAAKNLVKKRYFQLFSI
jgi:hypothetical protein